jgi:hypothetical protein
MNQKNEEIYSLGLQIGLKKENIDCIIKNPSDVNEFVTQKSGPPPYTCSLYGAISIRAF